MREDFLSPPSADEENCSSAVGCALQEDPRGLSSLREPGSDLLAVRDAATIDVSVCIANWNCREVLRGCLESLRAVTCVLGMEVVVVDNGSTDGAPEMVERDFPDVVLLRNNENAGFAKANNRAAQCSRGRYLLFLNNDTVVPTCALDRLLAFAEQHPEVGLIGPQLRHPSGELQTSYRAHPTVPVLLHRTTLLRWTTLFRKAHHRYRREEFASAVPQRVDILMGAAMLIPRRVFFEVGGWDENFVFGGEDMDLSVRIGARYSVVYFPGVHILHYGRTATRNHLRFASTHIPSGFVRYLRKTGTSRLSILLYKTVLTLDAPFQMVEKTLQALWRRIRKRPEASRRSLLVVRSLASFLVHGLPTFWKA